MTCSMEVQFKPHALVIKARSEDGAGKPFDRFSTDIYFLTVIRDDYGR
jgi:hypothetical protein